MKKIYLLFIPLFLFGLKSFSQTYFTETFEAEFTPNTANGPNAPTGWSQTRFGNTIVPGTPGGGGHRDWARQTWNGTAWVSNTMPNVAQTGNGTMPIGPAANGNGCAWFNDYWCNGSDTRRLETPLINLTSATTPGLSFDYFYSSGSVVLNVLASNDGGATYTSIGTVGATGGSGFSSRLLAVPAAYKVSNAKLAFQVASTYGSHDIWLDNVLVKEYPAANILSTTLGGLWSTPATWVGGALPTIFDNVIIADSATVTINTALTIGGLTIGQGNSGVLQWTNNNFALTVTNNINIAPGAKLLAYSTSLNGQTINVGGNFTNNGFANLAMVSTILNFNGSIQGSSLNQTLDGTGSFLGDHTKGVIRSLYFQTKGNSIISTAQNIITSTFLHTAGSLNTNGKLTIDNAAQVYGQSLNTEVANVGVIAMGSITAAPVVFGGSIIPWSAGGSASINSRYFFAKNVYLAMGSGTFNGSIPPTHTSGSALNGTLNLLWIGTLGTIGNPFVLTTTTLGAQYFYGNNLYVCTVVGIPDAAAPPLHTSGTVASGTASFLYVGNAATVTSNYDAATQTVRNLTLTSSGNGYSAAPNIVFSLNGGTFNGTPSAVSVLIQQIAGPANSLAQKGGIASISGGLNINSNQNAAFFSGVGNMSTINGGVNYSVAPTVGFAGPTAINLVTNPGNGYIAAPTITVTGGTLITGAALTTNNFTIVVAGGVIVSVYLNANTTATYSVPPTLAFSAGTATLAFAAVCWPAATANIGSNGQLTSFSITNAGFGYVAAPILGIGTKSGTGAVSGGTFTTFATAPTCRIALYNINFGYFSPATTNIINSDQSIIPTNGKANALATSSGLGSNISSNLELFSAAPITLSSGILDLGTNTLTFANTAYAGASGSATSSVSGKISLAMPGGSVTRTFPFNPPLVVATGTGSLASGSTVTSLTIARTAAPTGPVNGNGGMVTGTRAYRIQANAGAIYGTSPAITLNYTATDALVAADNPSLLIGQAPTLNGAWDVRSTPTGTGPLSATGTRIANPIATVDDYYAWVAASLCSSTPTTGVVTGPGTACSGNIFTLLSSVFSSGTGIIYRWQSSPDNINWTNTAGTTANSFSTSITAPTWFRRMDTCTNSNTFAVSNAVQITIAAPLAIPYNQGFETVGINNTLPGCMAATNLGTLNLTYTSPTGNYNQAARSGTNYASFRYNPGAAGAWFFSDPIQLTGGQAYDAHVWYVTDGAAGFDALNMAYGTAANAASMGTAFATKPTPTNTVYQNLRGTFTAPTTGVYVMGYQVAGTSSTPWYVTIDDLAVVPAGAFPVTFAQFKGERQGTNNLLSWTTSTELNNNGFEVQRSVDGINFTPLAFVASKAANGTSNGNLNYSLIDRKPFNSTSYYRLKQVDKDGKSALSSIVSIKGTRINKLELTSVYPNPAVDKLNILLSSPKAEKVTLIVSDVAGKAIMQQLSSVVNGDNNIQLNVGMLAKGTYTIKAICADGCETVINKFIKQ